MKSLGEIYWDIDHECLHSDKTISFSDETMMLFHAAEEYVEELRKHDDRWKSIVLHDIDYLKASSFIRREQKGYSEGAEIFLGFIYHELERYGFKIDDGDISSVKETNQPKTILETGDDKDVGNGDKQKADNKPMTKDEIIKSLEGKEQFVPAKPINLYDVFYDRLVKGKIKNKNSESHVLGVLRKICDDDKENVELFKRCVESADISNLYNEDKKSYARLFMNDIASLFSEPKKFRKAAAKSFGLKEGTELGAVGGNYKKDYRSLMNRLFDDNADYRNRNNS